MNINFTKNLLYFFFYFSFNLLIRCDDSICNNFSECISCMLCDNENILGCPCAWTIDGCIPYGGYSTYEGWYSKITTCQNLNKSNKLKNEFCPTSSSKKTESDLDKDKSLTFMISSNSQGFYGRNMFVCDFEYEQSTQDDIAVELEFSSDIFITPKVYVESTDVINAKRKETASTNQKFEFTKVEKIIFKVLLKDDYTTSPVKIKLVVTTSQFGVIISIIITILFIGIIIGCIIFCAYRMYKNNEARRQARMYIYRQAQENMARIQQENYNYYEGSSQDNSVDIEKINKEKLDQLFNTTMAQHLYKKEYNEFGGGCSICLAEFKKKSKVSITSCKHVFHYNCIHDWLYKNIRNPKCPNCNHEILNDEEENNNKKETKIIKVKKKTQQTNHNINNLNQQITIERGAININNGSNSDVSQSQRPQLGGEF